MAAKIYRKVYLSLWNEARFLRLSPLAKLIYLGLLTHPLASSLGALRQSPQGLAADLGLPFDRKFADAFAELSGLAVASSRPPLLYCPAALADNPPENANVVKSWVHSFQTLPECQVRDRVLADAEKIARERGPEIARAFAEAFAPWLDRQDATTEPSQADPIQYVQIQSDPIQSAPAQNEPVQADQIQTDPIQSDPIPSYQIQSDPIQSAPAQNDPLPASRMEQAGSDPVQSDQIQSDQIQSAPAQNDPLPASRMEQAGSDPVRGDQIQSDQIQSEALHMEQSDPVQSDPIQSDPAQSDPIQSDPIRSDPIRSGQIQDEPIHNDQIQSDPPARFIRIQTEGTDRQEGLHETQEEENAEGEVDPLRDYPATGQGVNVRDYLGDSPAPGGSSDRLGEAKRDGVNAPFNPRRGKSLYDFDFFATEYDPILERMDAEKNRGRRAYGPETASGCVSDTVSGGVSETVSGRVSGRVSETVSGRVSETVSETQRLKIKNKIKIEEEEEDLIARARETSPSPVPPKTSSSSTPGTFPATGATRAFESSSSSASPFESSALSRRLAKMIVDDEGGKTYDSLQASDGIFVVTVAMFADYVAAYPELDGDWARVFRQMKVRLKSKRERPRVDKMPEWVNFYLRNEARDADERERKLAEKARRRARVPLL